MYIRSHLGWILALRGLMSILFGLIALVRPLTTFTTLIALFGAFMLVDSGFAVASAIGVTGRRLRGALLGEGLLGLATGLLMLCWPATTALALLYFLAGWMLLTGVFEIVAALELRAIVNYHGWLGVVGALSLLLGIALIGFPYALLAAFVQIAGMFILCCGVALIILAWKIYVHSHSQTRNMIV